MSNLFLQISYFEMLKLKEITKERFFKKIGLIMLEV
jgi:hypothetical protein